ncbi:MAG: hypothetical protein K2W95_35320 [Candidatus Obscuribacterales bacterium]|nr:hypothetical protein [Candidatus Obscuribacterales bacterium]
MNNQIPADIAVAGALVILSAIADKGELGRDTKFARGVSEAVLEHGGSRAQRDWVIRLLKKHNLPMVSPPKAAVHGSAGGGTVRSSNTARKEELRQRVSRILSS